MTFKTFILSLAASAAVLGPFSMANAETEKDGVPRYVQTRVIPEKDAITPGEPLVIAIEQTHQESWHTYWKNPGDSGEPTSVVWTLPEGFEDGGLEFPTPHKIAYGPLMNFGYSGKLVLLATVTPPPQIAAPDVTIKGDVTWLVCNDICVPEMTTISLTLPVATPAKAAKDTDPELFAKARAAMPKRAVWQGMLEEQDQSLKLVFKPDDEKILKDIATGSDYYFFPEEWGVFVNSAPQDIAASDNSVEIKAERDTRPLSAISNLKGVLSYVSKDGTEKSYALDMAIMPQKAVSAAPVAGQPENGGKSAAAYAPEQVTLIQAIILAVLGGLVLNLMPCVFPVLSMKALSLVKMSEKEQRHASLHGLIYTAGILVCFGIIAMSLITLKSAGEEIGWGFQLQNPAIVMLLAYLLFVMALNLSGFFELKGHLLSNIGHKLTANHGYSGTFFTGVLATIVATPCTAPFMATAMGFALTQPSYVAIAVFMALGIGLALPYLAMCFIPAVRKSLPKPGPWMTTFRQFLAFPLYASVAWLIWVYALQVTDGYGVFLPLIGLVLIGFSIWVTRHTPKRQPWQGAVHGISYAALALALLTAVMSSMQAVAPATAIEQKVDEEILGHKVYTKAALDEALKGDDPVFVNMTAAWCITCKVNDRIALSTDATQALFKEKSVVYFQGDWTSRNAEITEFLAEYGRSGVPLYVYYGPRDTATKQRPEPQVLPQILTNGLVASYIKGNK